VSITETRHARGRVETTEVLTFLGVGGVGYIVDVLVFNLLLNVTGPLISRTVAVLVAMIATYVGNRRYTWQGADRAGRSREVTLFLVFNLVGFAISLGTLYLSHHVLGFTSRLSDNISANVIGVGLGTLFRFVTYRTFVFGEALERQ
jgi:putative flippase GtrA